jgi:anti-sigma factor RsiW
MKRFFNSCWRYRQDICLLAGGVLSEPERNQLENHLAACVNCRKYYEEMKIVTVPLSNWAGNFMHVQPRPAVQARWARAVHATSRTEAIRRLTPAIAFREWWRDVIWPCRRVWAGLAAVWVVILAGNFSLHEPSQTLAVQSSPQEMITSFKDQQKFLAELLTDHAVPREAERPKFFSPKPRTESTEVMTA